MGISLWAAAGVVIAILVRMISYGRTEAILMESVVAVVGAIVFGLVATWFDFGGWREVDWRSVVFAAIGALALIGLARLIRLAARLRRV